MDAKQTSHQNDLQYAFSWVEFAYRQGHALLQAIEQRLSTVKLPAKEVLGSAYTMKRSDPWRYVWLDANWYLPAEGDEPSSAAFVALLYHSYQWVGCHLFVGTAELAASSALLEKPAGVGHWLLDCALAPENPKVFEWVERDDGLFEHKPGSALEEECGRGIRTVLSAPFPVAWIDSDEKLSAITLAFGQFVNGNDASELGQLSKQARGQSSGLA